MMTWTELDTWIVLTGALVGMACVLPGVFLFLTRQSMLGDGISHAVLPGLAIAYLVTDSRALGPMVVGAVAAGVLTALFTQAIQRFGQVESGAALGVVFCGLFAVGLILIRIAADRVDLDADCVLYGSLETAVFDVARVPRVTVRAAALLLGNLVLVLLFYKELRMVSFDAPLATALGFSSRWVQLGLTVVSSVTAVIAFESVGSILVIAMFVVPIAAASLLTRRLGVMIALGMVFAAIAAVGGHVGAMVLPRVIGQWFGFSELRATSSTAMMSVCGGAIFVLCAFVQAFRFWGKRRRAPLSRGVPVDSSASGD
jgi:manganese/zinc/iron transport system permease protein